MARDKYQVCDLVSADKFVVGFHVRLLEGYGREINNDQYHIGNVFSDAASGIIWVENQVLLGFG